MIDLNHGGKCLLLVMRLNPNCEKTEKLSIQP